MVVTVFLLLFSFCLFCVFGDLCYESEFPPVLEPYNLINRKGKGRENSPTNWRDLRMFTYIYSLLIKKGICDRQNVSSFHMFVFMCTSIQGSLHFLVNFPFPFLFIELSVLQYFSFHVVSMFTIFSFQVGASGGRPTTKDQHNVSGWETRKFRPEPQRVAGEHCELLLHDTLAASHHVRTSDRPLTSSWLLGARL